MKNITVLFSLKEMVERKFSFSIKETENLDEYPVHCLLNSQIPIKALKLYEFAKRMVIDLILLTSTEHIVWKIVYNAREPL